MSLVKTMVATRMARDFTAVDVTEGGTGAAPLDPADHVGMSLRVGLWFVHNALVGAGLRNRIRVGVSGKTVFGFDMACVMALGADYCIAALDFMFAVGCIHAQSCHSYKYPVWGDESESRPVEGNRRTRSGNTRGALPQVDRRGVG